MEVIKSNQIGKKGYLRKAEQLSSKGFHEWEMDNWHRLSPKLRQEVAADRAKNILVRAGKETRTHIIDSVAKDVFVNLAEYIPFVGPMVAVAEPFYEHGKSIFRSYNHRENMRKATYWLREAYHASWEISRKRPTKDSVSNFIRVNYYRMNKLHFLYGGHLDTRGYSSVRRGVQRYMEEPIRRLVLMGASLPATAMKSSLSELVDQIPLLPNPPGLVYGTAQLAEINALARVFNALPRLSEEYKITELLVIIKRSDIINKLEEWKVSKPKLIKAINWILQRVQDGTRVSNVIDTIINKAENVNEFLSKAVTGLTPTMRELLYKK